MQMDGGPRYNLNVDGPNSFMQHQYNMVNAPMRPINIKAH